MEKMWILLVTWAVLLGFPTVGLADLDLTGIYARNGASVVTVATYTKSGDRIGQGSGFIIDKRGVLVTCLHIVSRADTIEVICADGSTHFVNSVLSTDKDWDVALLQVEPLKQPPLKLGGADEIRTGAAVVSLDTPSRDGNAICQGNISGLRAMNGDSLLQISGPIALDSNGGAILSPTTENALGMTVASESSGPNNHLAISCTVIGGLLKEALATDNPPDRRLEEVSPEVKEAILENAKIRDALESECTEADAQIINNSIETAIASGAGIYNGGDHRGCYRLYEGAAYKILYLLNGRAPTAISVLLTNALQKARTDESAEADDSNAWLMRHAFDSIDGIRGRHQPSADTTPKP